MTQHDPHTFRRLFGNGRSHILQCFIGNGPLSIGLVLCCLNGEQSKQYLLFWRFFTTPPTLIFVGKNDLHLSHLIWYKYHLNPFEILIIFGGPSGIWTHDQEFKRLLLWPDWATDPQFIWHLGETTQAWTPTDFPLGALVAIEQPVLMGNQSRSTRNRCRHKHSALVDASLPYRRSEASRNPSLQTLGWVSFGFVARCTFVAKQRLQVISR